MLLEQRHPKLFQHDIFLENVWDDEYFRSTTDDTGNMSDNDMETKGDKSKKKSRMEQLMDQNVHLLATIKVENLH